MLIITGADTRYFAASKKLLKSIRQYEPRAKVVYWDLGLSKNEKRELKSEFSEIQIKHFDFDSYPGFFRLERESYAWKGPIVKQSLEIAFDREYLWLDARCELIARLWKLRLVSFFPGILLFKAAGTNLEWTHPETRDYFSKFERFARYPQMAATAIFFRRRRKTLELVSKWSSYSFRQEVIAPEGSNRSNHRQDQSLLSNLYYERLVWRFVAKGLVKMKVSERDFGIQFHT